MFKKYIHDTKKGINLTGLLPKQELQTAKEYWECNSLFPRDLVLKQLSIIQRSAKTYICASNTKWTEQVVFII